MILVSNRTVHNLPASHQDFSIVLILLRSYYIIDELNDNIIIFRCSFIFPWIKNINIDFCCFLNKNDSEKQEI